MTSTPAPEGFQRVGFLAAMPRVLRDAGVDPTEVVIAAGLSPSSLDNPENTIPYTKMGHLVESAVERTGCSHLGLEIGKYINSSSLGVVGDLMRNAPTLRIALQDFAAHHHRNAHGGVVYLFETPKEAFFGYAVYQNNMPGHYVISDGAALAAFNIVGELLGLEFLALIGILLARPEPENLSPYLGAFGRKPFFNAAQTAVIIPPRLLDLSLPNANLAIRKRLLTSMSATLHKPDIMTQLRRELRVGLIRGDVSAIEISSRLGIERRTLQRRLDSLGCSYQGTLDEVRCEFAKQLLANTQLTIKQAGKILGYSDPSIFTRGFFRWTGMSPRQWRNGLYVNSSERSNQGRPN